MRALVLAPSAGDSAPARPAIDDHYPDPSRADGEALVDVRVAGVCDTDLQLARGYMGFRGVPGHEFVGIVAAGDDARWTGKRVVADINAGCGACEDCRLRAGHHCAARTVLGILGRGGAFAERLSIPERCLVEVPDVVDDEHAVFAEPLAAALHVLDEAGDVDAHEPIVVLGDGKLGLLVAMALRGAGHRSVLVGHHESKLALARAAGVETFLEEAATPALVGSPLVVEATGHPSGMNLAMRLVRPRGTIVMKTTVAGPIAIDMAPIVVHELRVVGSRCGDMKRAVAALARREIDPSPLVEARYGLSDAAEAFEHAGRRGSLKILVRP